MAGSDLRLSSNGRERLVQIIARLRSLQAPSVAAASWNELLASLDAMVAGQVVRAPSAGFRTLTTAKAAERTRRLGARRDAREVVAARSSGAMRGAAARLAPRSRAIGPNTSPYRSPRSRR
jgi:hypothetical protein